VSKKKVGRKSKLDQNPPRPQQGKIIMGDHTSMTLLHRLPEEQLTALMAASLAKERPMTVSTDNTKAIERARDILQEINDAK